MAYQITDSDARILRKMAARERRQTGSSPRSQRGQVLASHEGISPVQLLKRFIGHPLSSQDTVGVALGRHVTWNTLNARWETRVDLGHCIVRWPGWYNGSYSIGSPIGGTAPGHWHAKYHVWPSYMQFMLDPGDIVICTEIPAAFTISDNTGVIDPGSYPAYTMIAAPWRFTREVKMRGAISSDTEWDLLVPPVYPNMSDGTDPVAFSTTSVVATLLDKYPTATTGSVYVRGLAQWMGDAVGSYFYNRWVVTSLL